MTDSIATLAAAFAAGAALGALHLTLLWVGARALAGPRPALIFVALAALRAVLVVGAVAGLVALGAGAGELLGALAGFLVIRLVATRMVRSRSGEGVSWR